ncbi:MAG: 4Fe-4S dicluster domain-containing protein [Deltaproteobacteria bacterium]|nr:4Fe-4S dicluster domain-containing protein [Deltaproteobacteria bacterium]
MELQVIEKSDHDLFVENLIKRYRVEGVKRKNGAFAYGSIQSPEELCLDYDCTLLPPKKYFLPPEETLMRFSTSPTPQVEPVIDDEPFVLFGIHPYDLKAIKQMDKVFETGVRDPHYLKRREAALLIGVDPTRVSPRAFWADMEAATVSDGFDLMFTDIGERYVVEIGSEKGNDLMKSCAGARQATREEAQIRLNVRAAVARTCEKRGLSFPKREIPQLLERSRDRFLWEEQAARCLSCGTCNLVCPTCYCFDVRDDMDLDLVNGRRVRRWDGCLLEGFAAVATGENFRETRTARYQHRLYRKGLYLFRILDDVACVGCGRCSSSCLPDIADPVEVFNKLKEEE